MIMSMEEIAKENFAQSLNEPYFYTTMVVDNKKILRRYNVMSSGECVNSAVDIDNAARVVLDIMSDSCCGGFGKAHSPISHVVKDILYFNERRKQEFVQSRKKKLPELVAVRKPYKGRDSYSVSYMDTKTGKKSVRRFTTKKDTIEVAYEKATAFINNILEGSYYD